MTLEDRAAAFNAAFAKWPASHLHVVEEQGQPVLYGRWLIGNDYRNRSPLYGAYPAGYLARVLALFPDAGEHVLHAFAGSLPPGPYSRIDLVDRCGVPDLRFHQCDVCQVAEVFQAKRFRLVLADPPYSQTDAEQYGTPMVNRGRATAALAQVVTPGGHLVWLDVCWPMHRKAEWQTVARITLLRSTNHRVREISIFQRQT